MNVAEILNIIIGNAKEVVPSLRNHEFKPEDSLKGLGANSVDRSEIIMMTLEALSARIPMIYFAKAENIGELAAIFHEKK